MTQDVISLWTKKCIVCGKEFIPPNADQWAYKDGKHWFCRYNHMREWQKENEIDYRPQCASGRKIKDDSIIRKVVELSNKGESATAIGKKIGIGRQLVYYYLRTRK